MAEIVIDEVAMRDKASAFDSIGIDIQTQTNEMKNAIDSLKATYEGIDAEALLQSFATYAPTFEQMYNDIKTYANFLRESADKYESTKKTLESQAEPLRSRN